MPILRKETDLYPFHLFTIPTETAPWQIDLLRSRHEKTVARILAEAHIPFYLPQVQQVTTTSGRTHVSYLPLFPGYIFVRRVPGLNEALWSTRAVASVIDVQDQAQLTAELQHIRRLQESGAILRPRENAVSAGAVGSSGGSFVSLSILGQSFAVELPKGAKIPVKPFSA